IESEVEHPSVEVELGADAGAGQVPTSIHGLRTLGRATAQTDIGAMLNLDDLLVPDSSAAPTFHPVNAYGQAIAHIPVAAPAPAMAASAAAAAVPAPAPVPMPAAEEEAIE